MDADLIVISDQGREFHHGTMETEKLNYLEHSVKINAEFVTTRDNFGEIQREIQELIKKYAI